MPSEDNIGIKDFRIGFKKDLELGGDRERKLSFYLYLKARDELLDNVNFVIYEVNNQFEKNKSFKTKNRKDLFKTPHYETKEKRVRITGATLVLYNKNRISLKKLIIKTKKRKENQVGFNSGP